MKCRILHKTFAVLKKHPAILIMPVILDLVFFYILTRLHLEVFTSMSYHIKEISTIISEKTVELTQTQMLGLESYLIQSPEFMMHYHAMIYYIAIFFIGGFIAYLICQGVNWWLAQYVSVGMKKPFRYLGRFSLFSLAWFACFMLLLLMLVSFMDASAYGFIPLLGETASTILAGIIALILGYFAVVSYALPQLSAVKLSFSSFLQLFPRFMVQVVLFGLFIVLGTFLFTLHWGLLLALVLLIMIPSLTLFRIYTILSVKYFEKE